MGFHSPPLTQSQAHPPNRALPSISGSAATSLGLKQFSTVSVPSSRSLTVRWLLGPVKTMVEVKGNFTLGSMDLMYNAWTCPILQAWAQWGVPHLSAEKTLKEIPYQVVPLNKSIVGNKIIFRCHRLCPEPLSPYRVSRVPMVPIMWRVPHFLVISIRDEQTKPVKLGFSPNEQKVWFTVDSNLKQVRSNFLTKVG